MKSVKNLVASIATLCIVLFIFPSCSKENDLLAPVPNLESIIAKVETGQPLSTNEESFVDEYEATNDQVASRGDSIWLPTLMGSGSTIQFLPDYLQMGNRATLGFYFPPTDIKALITMKVTWTQDGRQKSKKVHKVIHKMGDPYDIWSLYLNAVIKVDYGTKVKTITKGINSKGCVKKIEEAGPWVYIP